MATLETLVADLTATLETTPYNFVRIPGTDYLEDSYRLGQSGNAHYQIRAQYENREFEDANQSYWRASVELVFATSLLNAGIAERDYTFPAAMANDLQTLQTLVLDPAWWNGRAAVYRVTDGPEMEDNLERIGNVMRWSMKVAFLLTP